MKLVRVAVLLSIAGSWPAIAQSWDTSGNGLLSGTYYFRQVVYYLAADYLGDLANARSVYGTITFDGNGKYTINETIVDGVSQSIQSSSGAAGTYQISASGFGLISNPISSVASDAVYGLVSHGIFIGSSTENKSAFNKAPFNDLFIAAPLASPAPTSASFQGTYLFSYINNPSGNPSDVYDAQFQMNPDGRGNIGTVNVTGYVAANGSARFNVPEPGVNYLFSGGAAVVKFPSSTNLPIFGQEYLYFSPDGNFIFGGAPDGWDMVVGVKVTAGAAPTFSGLYYQAGLDEQFASPDSYYGSFDVPVPGEILSHQRILALDPNSGPYAYDYSFSDTYSFNSDGTYEDAFGFHQVFGLGGAIRIGFGTGSSLGISVALQAPSFSGPGVYLNPTGVQNAASSTLFTAALAPGEFILLNGTGLASSALSDSTFPTTLGGVQVLINNRAAPIYVVSPTLIEALVPYEIPANSFAAIQVVNNSTPSNTVTVLTGATAPGLFTVPPGGTGYAAAQHADYSPITPSHPAKIGETIIIYGTGLGAVNPQIANGGVGSSIPPYSPAANPIAVYIDNQPATIGYAGLTPTAIGLYQLNVVVPAGVSTGDVFVDVAGPDSLTDEALISIGPGGSAVGGALATERSVSRARPHRPTGSTSMHRRVP